MGVTGLPPDEADGDEAYRDGLHWVWSFSQVPRSAEYRRTDRDRKIARVRELLRLLGNPQQTYPALLVAGTKGKGSTVAFVDACLRAGGINTGRLTSPHLVNWRERTVVGGEPISVDESKDVFARLRRAVAELDPSFGAPVTFDLCVLFALLFFAQRTIDVSVVEVGVGGRLDATNVLDPLVSAITPISYDHMDTLGHTLDAIARHKAGIMRPGRPVVVAPQEDEAEQAILDEARHTGARLVQVGRDWQWQVEREAPFAEPQPIVIAATDGSTRVQVADLALRGEHQFANATTAVATVVELGRAEPRLRIDEQAMAHGLASVEWPGRLQVLRREPLLVLDGAHNGASARVLAESVQQLFAYQQLVLVLGLTAGKDETGVLAELAPLASTILVTRSAHERAADPAPLLAHVQAAAPRARVLDAAEGVPAALKLATSLAGSNDLVLVTGSLFVVGEALAAERGESSA